MLQLTIIGNLGSDAEVKDFNGKKAVCFNVAHTDRWTDDAGTKHETTSWVSCILNGDGGNLLQYLKRGTTVYAVGEASTRVYSSPKERRMVAGLNLRVNHIELVGGRIDEVPRRLVTPDGLLVDTFKAYFINPDVPKSMGITDGKTGVLTSENGQTRFSFDSLGWVKPLPNESAEEQVF